MMGKESSTFHKAFSEYVDELNTPCKVYSPAGQGIVCEAIWDTGAEQTVISKEIAARLNLRVISKTRMYHVAGDNIVNTYSVYVGLSEDMLIGPVKVMEGNFDGNVVLIGMDIIGSGDLVVTNNDDHTEMAFGMPSTLRMDEIQKLL